MKLQKSSPKSHLMMVIPTWSHSTHSSMQPTELNYEIYDKELLAIFEAFWQWCNYVEG